MSVFEDVFFGKMWIVICGIGNDVRGDDVFGVFVVERLKELVKILDVFILNCGEMLESYVGKIVVFKLDLVVFVDVIYFGGEIGEFIIVDLLKIFGEVVLIYGFFLRIVVSYIKE